MKYYIIAFLLLIGCSCSQTDENPSTYSEPDNESFRNLTVEDHGIKFSNNISFSDSLNIIDYLYFNNGGGVAIGDIDNDGKEDLFLTANQSSDRLYKNLGDLQFEDISDGAGIAHSDSWSSGVTIDDVNDDGWLDIYICKVTSSESSSSHNELYINLKNGTFRESAEEYGLDFLGFSTQASFFDFDNDGDLDMYLLNHSIHSTKSYGAIDKRKIKDKTSGDVLFENRLNEKEKSFVDITSESGIYSSALGYGLGLVTSDFNNDGWVDIYVGNDFHDNDFLYINNKNGTFTEESNLWFTHVSQFSMGVDAGDINGDGLMDLFTTDMMPFNPDIKMRSGGDDTEQIVKIKKDFGYLPQYSRNMMQINNSNNGFIEVGSMTKTYATDWSWSPLIQDFNNDGRNDIFITNGIINRPNDLDFIEYINSLENRPLPNETEGQYDSRLISKMPTLKLKNILFTQRESMQFTPVALSGIGSKNFSNGAAYADFDLDGDLDIITNNVNDNISLLENVTTTNQFLNIVLPFNQKNAKVVLSAEDQLIIKEYTTTRGFQSASTHALHFGLGKNVDVVNISVHWLNGEITTIKNQKVDTTINVQPENLQNGEYVAFQDKIRRSIDIDILPVQHKENNYDDLDQEPLMPYKYSQKGPAALLEDFDNDGYKDLFLGASHGQTIGYYKGGAKVPWTKIEIPDFKLDSRLEDVDAAAFDFNKDGYKDIYVVSGGNQFNQQELELQDRIYINDTKGGFYRLNISLPMTNGSCIRIYDFDNDGYDDFFVGAQNVPGSYGQDPISFIIKNVNGQSLEIAAKIKLGMVNDAVWADLDNNGDIELLIAGDWLPLKAISFKDEKFIDVSSSLNLPEVSGLFNCIEVAHLNDDQKLDIIIGNIGENSAWQLGNGESIKMFVSDFDNNTFADPIIFYPYFGTSIPFANRGTLKSQIPTISKIFPSFDEFRKFKDIGLIKNEKVSMEEKQINILSSFILLSSDNEYHIKKLPQEAQFSSINDVVITSEGSLLYVGNTKSNSHQLGQLLGSRGGLLSVIDKSSGEYQKFQSIGLPAQTVSKKIIPFSANEFLVINNNSNQFIIEVN